MQSRSSRSLRGTRFLAAFTTLLIALSATAAVAEDIRTRTLRLVPSKAWTPNADVTYTVLPGKNNSDHGKSDAFVKLMQAAMVDSLDRLDYKTQESGGEVTYEFTVDVYDPGSTAMRFAVGFGAGKGTARGKLTIKRKGKVVGQYEYSSRLRGAGTKALAKEVGPAIVLQLHNGDVDTELHEIKESEKDS